MSKEIQNIFEYLCSYFKPTIEIQENYDKNDELLEDDVDQNEKLKYINYKHQKKNLE